MDNESWKKMVEEQSLGEQLDWLIRSKDSWERNSEERDQRVRYLRKYCIDSEKDKTERDIEYFQKEAEAQRERYYWIIEYIESNYVRKL